jgi:hypothetical protein
MCGLVAAHLRLKGISLFLLRTSLTVDRTTKSGSSARMYRLLPFSLCSSASRGRKARQALAALAARDEPTGVRRTQQPSQSPAHSQAQDRDRLSRGRCTTPKLQERCTKTQEYGCRRAPAQWLLQTKILRRRSDSVPYMSRVVP